MQVFLFLSGIMLLILTSATSSKGQNMKVHISAFEDTIIFKFIRPHDNSRLDGYILGYGSSMFSKQLIHLPGNGELYETEIDAEPKYLIAVQSVNPDKPKKKCAGKVNLQKPLNIMIGSVTETSVLLSWGTLLTSPFMDTNVDDCFDDGQFTVRYREKEPSNTWKYQTCPTTSMVIDDLKPDAQYEFEVRPDTDTTSGTWSTPVIHNTADETMNEPFEELNQAKPKNTTQAKPAPLLARTVLPEVQTTTEAEIITDPIFLDDLPTSTQTPEFPHTSITLSTSKIASILEHKELTSQPSTTPDQPITITPQALTTEHQPTTTYQPTTTHQHSTTQEEPTSTTQEEPTSTTQEQTTSTTQEEPTSTTQEEPTSTTQEETTSTTQEHTTSTTQEETTSTTQEQTTSTTQEQTTSTTQEETTSTTQEQTTTTQVSTKEQQYTTRQQMIAAEQQFIITTSDPIPTQTNPPPTKPPLTQQHTTSKVPLRTVRPSPPKEPDTITQDNRNTGEIRPKLRPPRPILHSRGTSKHQTTDSYHFHQTISLYQSSTSTLSQQQLNTTVGHSPQSTLSTPSSTVANRKNVFVLRPAIETNKESIYSTKPPISKYSTHPHHTTDKPTKPKPTSYPKQLLPTLWYQPRPSTSTQHSSTAKQHVNTIKYHPDITETANHNINISERAKHFPDITAEAKHNPDVSETAKHYIGVTGSPKYNPDITENAKHYPDIIKGTKYYPDIIKSAKYYTDITEKHYPDVTEGAKHYPDVTKNVKHYTVVTESTKHYSEVTQEAKLYPHVTESAKHYPDVTEGAKHYPDVTKNVKHYTVVTESAKHYPEVTQEAKLYPHVTESAKKYPDVTEGAKHYPDVTENVKYYPEVTQGAKLYPHVTESAKHYPDVTEGAKHYPDVTEGAKPYPDITKTTKHYPDITESPKYHPDVTKPAKHYPDTNKTVKHYPEITETAKHYLNVTETAKHLNITETAKHHPNMTKPVKHYPNITQTPKHNRNMTKTAKSTPKTESQIEIPTPNPTEQLPGTSKNLELKPTKSKTPNLTKSDAVQDSSVTEKVTVRMDQPNGQAVSSQSKDKPLTNEVANRTQGRGIFRNSSSDMTHKPRLNGRVSPNRPINSTIQRNSNNNRERVPNGVHHIGLRVPKPGKVPRKNKVKQNTNQVPESTQKKNDIDLKQLDKLPLKPLAPPTTEKPTYLETTQIPRYFNGSRFDTGDNSSVFSPVPVSKTDAMGKERFIAPHVVYKTDKRPEEPCSVTNSLSYFPEEEVGYINVTGPPKTPPSNLTVVTVEGCPSFVILDWEKTDNETTEYKVVITATEGPNEKEKSIVTTNQTFTAVENLVPERSYEFEVTPKNEFGTGPSSDPVTFSTESADPRVSEIPTGKTAIWSSFPFKADSYTECNGKQFIKRTWYRKFVGIQLCNSLRYKIYLSDSLKGKFYSIGDQAGLGEDHCQFVDSYLDGRTGGPLSPNELPPRQGYFRAVRQEPVRFGEIGGNSLINYVAWYECGIPIPGKW
ncbi:uncharacterized protein abi3bpa [Misgurnus anguillicaudatus]|uniref:uncharacterized protein abi3bpa n=1 Tax=Misgurnus anguillicaudatus TaxID=75329 RepID=UPI003CCF9C45